MGGAVSTHRYPAHSLTCNLLLAKKRWSKGTKWTKRTKETKRTKRIKGTIRTKGTKVTKTDG